MAAAGESDRDIREQFNAWKRLVPYLYDSFTNHHLTWPSLSCRWGPLVHETATRRKQRLYLSDQTDGSEPNKLVLVTAEVARPRLSSSEAVSTWSEAARSPSISTPLKTLVHPGEVNKLLDVPQHPGMVVTHSDCPDVFLWSFDAQPDRGAALAAKTPNSRTPSVADAVLKGHTENAEFALATSTAAPAVASGGKDRQVLVWDLEDAGTGLAGRRASLAASLELHPRAALAGHHNTVEDVAFMPGSKDELMSVADDYSMLFWDLRAGTGPVDRVSRAHGERDVHCCDWAALRPHLVATGAQDGGVRVWDKRNLGGALAVLNHHTEAVMNVEWSPHRPGLFATGADDGLVCLWDVEAGRGGEGDGPGATKRAKVAAPPQLLFQHAGHQSPVVDFCWNPTDPWTLLSASVDVASSGGGTLQIWRVSDLVYRPEDEVLAELEPYKDYIVTGEAERLEAARARVAAAKRRGEEKEEKGDKGKAEEEDAGAAGEVKEEGSGSGGGESG